MKAAPDKSHFFLTRVKFLGYIIECKLISALKSQLDAVLKLQPPSNKEKLQELVGIINFFLLIISKKCSDI